MYYATGSATLRLTILLHLTPTVLHFTLQHRLLVPVLEGLTKFAPLLDVEMLNLLLTAIKDLLNLSHTHPLTGLFLCL